MKNKSIVPVSYLLEARFNFKKEEKKKVEIDNDKSLNAIKKMMITWKENVNRYTQKFSRKRIQLCLFCFEN